jgi:hypothetical protein
MFWVREHRRARSTLQRCSRRMGQDPEAKHELIKKLHDRRRIGIRTPADWMQWRGRQVIRRCQRTTQRWTPSLAPAADSCVHRPRVYRTPADCPCCHHQRHEARQDEHNNVQLGIVSNVGARTRRNGRNEARDVVGTKTGIGQRIIRDERARGATAWDGLRDRSE